MTRSMMFMSALGLTAVLTAALLEVDQAPDMKPTLEDLLITRFVATRPEDFRVFLERQRAAEAAGYPRLA